MGKEEMREFHAAVTALGEHYGVPFGIVIFAMPPDDDVHAVTMVHAGFGYRKYSGVTNFLSSQLSSHLASIDDEMMEMINGIISGKDTN